MSVRLAARVMKEILTDDFVLGLTSVHDELFVLLHRQDKQVAVYSINDYKLLRHLNVPGFEPDVNNYITSCVRHKCLFMSDRDNCFIRRYDLANSATSKWSVSGKPCGLSVTPSCTLLVTCQYPGSSNKLIELNADSGWRVREVVLQSDIAYPWHSVQLTTGQFVVCHSDGYAKDGLHRVCVVGNDGEVTHSYGGQYGSDVGQLYGPCHLAVDKGRQVIFVADEWNDRVVLLSPTLKFVRCLSERMPRCHRMYLHEATRRLFVVTPRTRDRSVTVIKL